MNNLIKPFLDAHIASYELESEKDITKVFEHFFNYLTVRNYTSRHFDPSDISLGKGEVGIDGVAIIVNDILVTSMPQIEELFKLGETDISVSFVFVQSKTSETFESKEMSQFFAAVNDFLTDGKINMNEKAAEFRSICKYIIKHPTQLSKNPDCHLFYSFTGKDSEDKTRNALVEQEIDTLKRKSVFDEVTFALYDAEKIIAACRAIRNSVKKTIDMVDCAVMPKVHNINEAYIGIVKCKDFIRLITNDDGAILSNLFEDNVRYFQGHNIINAEIQATLRSPEKQEEFSVLNNGVTIVAREMRRTGNSFTLSGFQVINGCQTSFVLYENRSKLSEQSCIVLKIISTTDKNITDSIVKTTNRQTPVLNEAFETLRDFHKNLELAYASYDVKNRLYYERRSKQYDSAEINKNKIISFPFQTSAYVAVFLGEPHSTHRYYGELLKSYSKRIYNDRDILEQYCMASMYVYTVDTYLKHNEQYSAYKKYKYHIALILRHFANANPLPDATSKEMKKYCSVLYAKISNDRWVQDSIRKACIIIKDIIDDGQVLSKGGNDLTRTKEFTNKILERMGLDSSTTNMAPKLPALKKNVKVKCKVINWNKSFAYVELTDYKEIGSIYIGNISEKYISSIDEVLTENQEVEATILEDKKHPTFGYSLTMRKG
ncbi:MAG: hypothetical protein HFH95_14840 [Lachnospiraceae bacterium]|nr:hypothetical protein [Lachnospiraceae bacterium]